MVLMEVFDPKNYEHLNLPGEGGQTPMPKDYLAGLWKLIKGTPNLIIPDSVKQNVANSNNGFWQYILSALGAQQAGTAGGDLVRNSGQKKGEGQNAGAHEPLHVNAAVNWLRNNAYPYYIKGKSGNCARYVKRALNRGGLDVPYGMPHNYAKDYYNILRANGWQEIPANQAGELCDVVVIMPCIDSAKREHPAGHIAMCIGNSVWASDFIQKSMYGLQGEPPPSAVHVFRYRNRVH